MNSISFGTGRLRDAVLLVRRETSLGSTPAIRWSKNENYVSMTPQSGYAMSSGERVLYDILNSLAYGHPVSLYNLTVLDAETRRVAWEAIGIASGIEGARPSNEAAAAYACGYADCKEGLQNRNPFLTTARKDHDS